jgi:hypothetical protein
MSNHANNTARPTKNFHNKPRKFNKPRPEFTDRTERQMWRHKDLINQFRDVYNLLVGQTAMLVLAGDRCQHDPNGVRPLHRDQQWPNRPALVALTATADQLTLTTTMSFADNGKLHYVNGNGEQPASWDFFQTPRKGANGQVLDGFVKHALFTCGNNLLQYMVNNAGAPVGEFSLPKLLIRTNRVVADGEKLDALVAAVDPSLQAQYRVRKMDDAGIMIGGVLFGDADLMPDADVALGIKQRRAYEDYADMLGSEEINPARKLMLPANPAREVIQMLQLPGDWAQTLTEELATRMIREMRKRLPLPEMATDSDLLNALERPSDRVHFSIPVEKVPTSAILRAMRATIPGAAAIGRAVTDVELIEAAKNPLDPLVVKAYSRIQCFRTEDMKIPSYATGGFFAQPRAVEVPLA